MGHEETVTGILADHLPEVLAHSMLRRARASAGGDPQRLLEELRKSVSLFVDPTRQRDLLQALDGAMPKRAYVAPERVMLNTEADVSRARLRARELSQLLGGGAFGQQRASTAVSELARNIVMYAGRGHIDLIGRSRVPAVLSVRAVDQGPGIADMDLVLSGTFKSKTGLGRGLRGVKLLSSSFNLQSSSSGTIVEADIPI
jgi:serine/threonine-protein kinase RsbT